MSKLPAINCSHTRLEPISKLKPNPRNPNKHDEGQLALYIKILKHQGWRKAITVSRQSGLIVTGHGAYLAAKAEGWPKVPIDVQDFKSKADETAHMLADNKLPQLADLDLTEVAKLVEGLDGKLDLDLTGFDLNELSALAGGSEVDAEPQMDRAAELQKEWKTKSGQVWRLGEHRLACGSCLKETDLESLLRGDPANFIYSDAPYGISIVNPVGKVSTGLPVGPALCRTARRRQSVQSVGGDIHKGMKARPIIASNLYAKIIGDDNGKTARAAFQFLHGKFPKALHVWFGANHFSEVFPPSSCWIVWDKDNGESFFADGELAWCSAKTAVRIFKHQWNGLLKASERGQSRCHPTQKPVALAEWCLKEYGKPDDVVLDPFSGSGSCLLACERLERRARAMEIDPGYVATALQRFKDATGKTPVLLK